MSTLGATDVIRTTCEPCGLYIDMGRQKWKRHMKRHHPDQVIVDAVGAAAKPALAALPEQPTAAPLQAKPLDQEPTLVVQQSFDESPLPSPHEDVATRIDRALASGDSSEIIALLRNGASPPPEAVSKALVERLKQALRNHISGEITTILKASSRYCEQGEIDIAIQHANGLLLFPIFQISFQEIWPSIPHMPQNELKLLQGSLQEVMSQVKCSPWAYIYLDNIRFSQKLVERALAPQSIGT